MIAAELEIFCSRPVAPTRRVALGHVMLPMDDRPGYGAALLAAVVATFRPKLDAESANEFITLVNQVERGQRIAQPRLRYRFQQDRVGLTRATHQLVTDGERWRFRIDKTTGTAPQYLLGAVYACAAMIEPERAVAIGAINTGLSWHGAIDNRFLGRVLRGASAAVLPTLAVTDPMAWARRVLRLDEEATRTSVQRKFRDALRDAHPDHGAAGEGAADRIADLVEARRILLS